MRRQNDLLRKAFLTQFAFPALYEKVLYQNKGTMEAVCKLEKSVSKI